MYYNDELQHTTDEPIDDNKSDCQREIFDSEGNVSSPNYPDSYPNDKRCAWLFVAAPGHRVKLEFKTFELEVGGNCSNDSVVVYDGDAADSRTLGRYCGSRLPRSPISSANRLYVVFESNLSIRKKGFQAVHRTVCGGHLRATDQVRYLYSHAAFGDAEYENNTKCEWVVEADYGYNVHLAFLTFELESNGNKECPDFVSVHSGFNNSGPLYGKYCGDTIPANVVSSNNTVVVHFKTDHSVTKKGFSAYYVAIAAETTKIQRSLV